MRLNPYKLTPPAYKLIINGENSTKVLQSRLLSLSVTSTTGYESDTINISLDDRDSKLEIPESGAEIVAKMGYLTKLVTMGTYKVDSRKLSSPPQQFDIGGKAIDMKGKLLSMQTKNWTETKPITLSEIVSEIANKNGYKPAISTSLKSKSLDKLEQKNQSGMDLLTDLADLYNAIVKPTNKYLIFAEKGMTASVTGKLLTPVIIKPQDIQSWSIDLTERNDFGKVKTNYLDYETGDIKQSEAKSSTGADKEKVFVVDQYFTSKQQADDVAKAKLKELQQGKDLLTMTIIGEPEIFAEAPLMIDKVRKGVNGIWVVQSVTHTINNNGYTAQIKAYKA